MRNLNYCEAVIKVLKQANFEVKQTFSTQLLYFPLDLAIAREVKVLNFKKALLFKIQT